MTDRLYYDDAYLLQFDGTVQAVRIENGKYYSALDRSAFYPTSGGQPFDTGTLNGIPVTDVAVDSDGIVWHETAEPLTTGATVHGEIDAVRRTDHMVQHAADHMIAGTLYEMTRAMTIGLHIGAEVSSIDVSFADGSTRMDAETIAALEDTVNRRVRENGVIKCWFPTIEELERLPLRKKPTVSEHIRVVAIGDYEMVACGGTHPARTGEIGLVKILEVTPARGKARITFVAGERAFRHYRACYDNTRRLSTMLTTAPENLPENVAAMQAKLKDLDRELRSLRRQQLFADMENIVNTKSTLFGNYVIISTEICADQSLLSDFSSKLVEKESRVALISAKNEKNTSYVFARSADVDLDMGKIIRAAGVKGGGKPDFARGSGEDGALETALRMIIGR